MSQQQQFKGYSEGQMKRIASKLGHTGDLSSFNNYLGSNPVANNKYNALKDATIMRYASGGMVKSGYAEGGFTNDRQHRILDPIQQAYMDNVGRLPNDAGYNYYKNSGKSIEDIKADLAYSDEGKQYGVTKDNESIQNLFKEKLGRFAGQQGQDFYAKKVAELKSSGKTSEEALASVGLELDSSTEGKQRIANPDQQRYVSEDQRVYDKAHTMEWREGGNNRQYTQPGPQYNTTDQPIDALGRTGDNTAADKAAIQQAFIDSTGRQVGNVGLDGYTNLLNTGTNLDTIKGQIAGSEEATEFTNTGQQRYVTGDNKVDGIDYNTTDKTLDDLGRIENWDTLYPDPVTSPVGTPIVNPNPVDGGITFTPDQTVGQTTVNQSLMPELPTGATATATKVGTAANQFMDTSAGQLSATSPTASATTANTSTADAPTVLGANTVQNVATAAPAVSATLGGVNAAQGNITEDNKVTAAQQVGSSVSSLTAAQESTATQVDAAPVRSIEGGELVNPVADAQKAAAFTEQITAAQADPSSKATVQGQLATLMTSFDEGKTPAWAAGAMRNVTAQMAARGLGSSSMAGQALIQTALESALPIATADAQTFATFEMTNLNNKQQRAMLSAQQRATFMGQEFDQAFQSRVLNTNKISEIANMNFTATQQIAIENAQLASTVNLANLSNRQGGIMAEAAALSQLDISNLNNRQQEQVQNAKSFLDMDMSNLSNEQQTRLFKAQQNTSALLSDASATNAAKQFNATSENQTDQFFAGLASNVAQFNAAQKNAQEKFNAGEANSIDKFNKEIQDQRDQFNAKNSLIINQSNAQWRREIATADTVAINRANEINAKSLLDISNTAYNNLWQESRDEMDWVHKNASAEADRFATLAAATIAADAKVAVANAGTDAEVGGAVGELITKIILKKME